MPRISRANSVVEFFRIRKPNIVASVLLSRPRSLALAQTDYMDIRGLVADHMGHFSVYDIPGVLFVLLMATLMSFVLAKWGARLIGDEARTMALWGAGAAMATAFVRSQLPIAVLVLAAAVLVGRAEMKNGRTVILFSVLTIGIGCGSGASIVVGLALIPYFFILRWAFRSSVQ